jgi:hypothetical protein
MTTTLTIERQIHFTRCGRKEMETVMAPGREALPPGRVPRVARLMALAIRCDGLMRSGVVCDYAEMARLGHVSRSRVSQVLSLVNLAPDIQEAILFLPRTQRGRAALILADVLPIASLPDWSKQRRMWQRLAIESAAPGD